MREESEHRYLAAAEYAMRVAWADYRVRQAECLESMAAALAAQHREKTVSLREGSS